MSGLVRTSKEIRLTEPQDEHEEMSGGYHRHPGGPGVPATLQFLPASKSGLPFLQRAVNWEALWPPQVPSRWSWYMCCWPFPSRAKLLFPSLDESTPEYCHLVPDLLTERPCNYRFVSSLKNGYPYDLWVSIDCCLWKLKPFKGPYVLLHFNPRNKGLPNSILPTCKPLYSLSNWGSPSSVPFSPFLMATPSFEVVAAFVPLAR